MTSTTSTARDVTKLISTIELHFPMSKFADETNEEAWTASMVRFLSPYSPDVLGRAAEHIIKTRDPKRDGKWFPVPSEIIAACDLMRRAIQIEQTPLLTHGQRDQNLDAGWRVDLANDLVKTPLGREAAKKGWIGALWAFCRRAARLPEARELPAVKAEAQVFDEALDACERGEAGPMSRKLAELGRSIKDRRSDLAAKTGETINGS